MTSDQESTYPVVWLQMVVENRCLFKSKAVRYCRVPPTVFSMGLSVLGVGRSA